MKTNKQKQKKKQKTKQNTHTHTHTQNMGLTATTSGDGEVVQKLASTTSELGLGREAQSASSVLRVKTGPECPEDNLRELL